MVPSLRVGVCPAVPACRCPPCGFVSTRDNAALIRQSRAGATPRPARPLRGRSRACGCPTWMAWSVALRLLGCTNPQASQKTIYVVVRHHAYRRTCPRIKRCERSQHVLCISVGICGCSGSSDSHADRVTGTTQDQEAGHLPGITPRHACAFPRARQLARLAYYALSGAVA